MSSKCKSLLFALVYSMIVASLGLIIELPSNYNRTAAPWEQLDDLNLRYLKNVSETECLRTCVAGKSRICVYTLILENYVAMGTACGKCAQGVLKDCFRSQCIVADGQQRGLESINRKLPGPPIHVCKNDLIVAKVSNRMTGTGATLHWHGVLQKHSQFMDGVPRLSQCPIGAGERFVYIFLMEEAGTMFYHSHTGQHKMNGHIAALISREPRDDEPWSPDVYSMDLPEHTMVVSDWMLDYAEMYMPGCPNRPPGNRPTTFLVNGLGWYRANATQGEETPSSNISVPLATFHVEKGRRYRLRIINAATMFCPMQIQIEDHNMTLIATDGRYIEPVTIDTLVTHPGERFDIVIETYNGTLKKNAFWIHIRGLGICDYRFKLDQYAVLSYGTNTSDLGIIPTGQRPTVSQPLVISTIVNHPNTTCGANPNRLCISDLKAIGRLEIDTDVLTGVPDVRLFLTLNSHRFTDIDDFHKENNYHRFSNPVGNTIEAWCINNISFFFLTDPSEFNRDSNAGFCNPHNLPSTCQSSGDNSTTPFCECPYYEIIKNNDLVELILIDNLFGINHPMHLHGYGFFVKKMVQDLTKQNCYTVDEIKRIEEQEKNKNNTQWAPPIKDTVIVPNCGYTVIRFRANNPGDWMMHCHIDSHAIGGMVMVFRVEGYIPKPPPGHQNCSGFTLF